MLMRRALHYFALQSIACILVALSAYGQTFEYPLEIGTRWAWGYNYYPSPLTMQEVMRDTVMPNGHQYAVINPDVFFSLLNNSSFERRISNRVYRYFPYADTEYLWCDFSAHEGDTINHNPNIILQQIYTDTLFGKARRAFSFLYDPVPDAIDDEIYFQVTDSVGVSSIDWYNGFWSLRGAQIGGRVFGTLTHAADEATPYPSQFLFKPVYPNPFNGNAQITFTLPRQMDVSVAIYDELGREISLIVHQTMTPGAHSFNLSSEGLSSGVYFCRVNADGILSNQKMVILK